VSSPHPHSKADGASCEICYTVCRSTMKLRNSSGPAWVLPPEKCSCFPIDSRYAGSALRLSEIKLGSRMDRAEAAV